MNLRADAAGKPCTIRVPGVCNFDPSTSVLAHVRIAGITGGGQKAPDILAAIACSACHDLVDGRVKSRWTKDELRLMHLEGVARTLYQLTRQGYDLQKVR